MVVPALVALAILLWTGDVISDKPPEVIGHGSSGRVSYSVFVIDFSFHWAVLVPLFALFVAGLSCIVISSRRPK
jgi:hypothetical protein